MAARQHRFGCLGEFDHVRVLNGSFKRRHDVVKIALSIEITVDPAVEAG
jgi:hypothetical protein